ncbi:MAG: sulfatase-like hydrolase/transferase [Candidatus Aminicenantes bacterium]|nr:MAG: sulfatase-like hydrolase/transferase [Candidatus Aminicenantes bacterium]
MKHFKKIFLLFLLIQILRTAFFSVVAEASPKKNPLNVLLITIDTLRPDRLSCYSEKHVHTPNIDSLADRGTLFLKAFAHTPTTLPSHTNILLGTTPIHHGVHDNQNFIVREEFMTLAEYLKGNGYATGAVVGAFPLDSRFGLTQGFDLYDDNYGSKNYQEFSYVERPAEVVVKNSIAWIAEQSSPWFLWAHCFDPHQQYNPPEPFMTRYKESPYNGEVAYVDHELGKLLTYLMKNRLVENTLIVFTGDHGESLGQHGESTHGYFAYNSTIWIPLIIISPGMKSVIVDQNVCHVDIFPTVCDVLGLEKPDFLQGISLAPVLKGKRDNRLSSRAIYFESLYPFYSRGWAPLSGIIQKNTKYINSPIPEFYDLKEDFDEVKNLAEQEKLDAYQSDLEKLIEAQSYSGKTSASQKIDREALEKLRSLGYISSPQTGKKSEFATEDDLKVLLPYQNRLQKAMGAFHSGRVDEGIAILEKIIQERKDFDQAYAYLATLLKVKKDYKGAVEILREGYKNCPTSYKVITTFGIFLTEVREYDAAIHILQEGLKLIDYDPDIWNYLGVAYWRKGELDHALEAFHESLELDINYSIALNNTGSVYLSRFLKTKDQGDLQNAITNFQKAIGLDPGYASAYNGLGAAYSRAGNVEGAIVSWKKAVEINPDLGFALYNLGLAFLRKGDKEKALDYLSRYKQKEYQRLSPKEKEKLDALIQSCRQRQ